MNRSKNNPCVIDLSAFIGQHPDIVGVLNGGADALVYVPTAFATPRYFVYPTVPMLRECVYFCMENSLEDVLREVYSMIAKRISQPSVADVLAKSVLPTKKI